MIRRANRNDYEEVCRLLESENLPTSDLSSELPDFFLKVEDDMIAGSIGLELFGDSALLRSMLVIPGYRKKGIAAELVDVLIIEAKKKGVRNLYLITNTAEDYFKRKGFVKIERTIVVDDVLASKEFNGLCPASSAIMMKQI